LARIRALSPAVRLDSVQLADQLGLEAFGPFDERAAFVHAEIGPRLSLLLGERLGVIFDVPQRDAGVHDVADPGHGALGDGRLLEGHRDVAEFVHVGDRPGRARTARVVDAERVVEEREHPAPDGALVGVGEEARQHLLLRP
jgi:hypothetical protein